jgi:hypothetical protein
VRPNRALFLIQVGFDAFAPINRRRWGQRRLVRVGAKPAKGGGDQSRRPRCRAAARRVRTRDASRRAEPTLIELPLARGTRAAARVITVSVMGAKKGGG